MAAPASASSPAATSPPATACIKCGGPILVPSLDTTQGSVQARRRDVLVGLRGGASEFNAHVCTRCGYTELYVANLDYLLQK